MNVFTSNYFKDLVQLFYPELCTSCFEHLGYGENILCTNCKHQLPFTYYDPFRNILHERFYGKFPVKIATALLLFKPNNSTQKLIHHLKYKNKQNIGVYLGDLLGEKIKKHIDQHKIDFIIPVPLHPHKLKTRGYNQLTKFGNQLSKKLAVPYLENILIRVKTTATQTKKNKIERSKNTATLFQIKNTEKIVDKHVLLIDDVITTGATIEACVKEILKAPNVTISIATMAHTVNF